MNKAKFEKLVVSVGGSQWRSSSETDVKAGTRIKLLNSRTKSVGWLSRFARKHLVILLEDGSFEKDVYSCFEQLDSSGNPIPTTLYDMTGREIKVGGWLVFSCCYGTSHSLKMAQVNGFTAAGWISVTTTVQEGLVMSARKDFVRDPERALLLPFDESEFVMFRLSDFRKIESGE